MKSRRLLAIVLASSIMISGISTHVKAEEVSDIKAKSVQKENAQDVSAGKLAEVTKNVKSKIPIPKEFTIFNYEYYGSDEANQLRYNLSWSENEDGSSVRVICDGQGNINSCEYYEADQKYNYIPKLKRNQLQENADLFLNKAMPVSIGRVRLTDSNVIYSGRYVYTYERIENGIPMPENMVQIEVSYETGKVLSFQSTWEYGLSFPSADALISEKEAKEKLKDKLQMNLAYHNTYFSGKSGQDKDKIFLAYTPYISTLAIDAKSGKLYTTKGEKESDPMPQAKMEGSGMAKDAAADAGSDSSSLTGEEIKKIDEIGDIISSEKAISVIRKNTSLLLDKNATQTSARLYQTKVLSEKNKQYQWEIRFSYPKEKADQLGYYYANAVVNAKTGKILAFHADKPDNSEGKTVQPKYKKTEAVKQIEAFFSSQLPEYFKQCAASNLNSDGIMLNNVMIEDRTDQDVFQYNRVYKNIPYSGNGLYAAMDTGTGKIYQFSYRWDDAAVFEDPENRITEQAAEDAYLSYDSIPLLYEINWENNKPIVRLVYRTEIQPFYVSPFNGSQLNYDGKEYTPQESRFKYQDIGSSSAKESIEILADLGLGFSGGLFYPKKAITVEEWKSLEGDFLSSYENNEILKKWDVWNNEKKTVTRLDAAKYCVIASGLNKAAILPDTYQVTYKDKDKIPVADAGYVMLAKGLNLVTGDSDNNLNPDTPVTREEAAQIIMNLIKQR